MQTTRSLLGASRLPLTTKHGNKDFYKGTRQAYVPGTNVRTGTPGVHLLRGPGKFRIHDDKVRYYVAPPPHVLQETKLGPYSSAKGLGNIRHAIRHLPPFSPMPIQPHEVKSLVAEQRQILEGENMSLKDVKMRLKDARARRIQFAREYRALSMEEREALKMEARRKWWTAMQDSLTHPDPAERKTGPRKEKVRNQKPKVESESS